MKCGGCSRQCPKLNCFPTCLIASCPHEKERTHAQTFIRCPLSYLWRLCWKSVCAEFRDSALQNTRRPPQCRYGGHQEEGWLRVSPDSLFDNSRHQFLLSC